MTPAIESSARMKLTGPDAVPLPESFSIEPRSLEKFTPDPDPPLKIIASDRAVFMIESIESSISWMKQADS
jgi:hypothetical protein